MSSKAVRFFRSWDGDLISFISANLGNGLYRVGDLWVAYFQSINCFIGLPVFWFSSLLSGLTQSMIKGAKYLCVNMLHTNCQFLHKIHLSQQGLLSDKNSKPPPLQKLHYLDHELENGERLSDKKFITGNEKSLD